MAGKLTLGTFVYWYYQGHLLVSSQLEHVARSLEEQFTSHSDFSMHVQNEHRSGSHNDGSNSVNDSLAQDDGPSSDSINISDSLVFGGTVSVCAESETEAACRRSGRPVYKTLLVKQWRLIFWLHFGLQMRWLMRISRVCIFGDKIFKCVENMSCRDISPTSGWMRSMLWCCHVEQRRHLGDQTGLNCPSENIQI